MPNEDRRIVLEHKDGRRVSCMESQVDDPSANPFNFGGPVYDVDASNGHASMRVNAARPDSKHISLQKEGFKPVASIHGPKHRGDCPYSEEDCPGEGAEIPL